MQVQKPEISVGTTLTNGLKVIKIMNTGVMLADRNGSVHRMGFEDVSRIGAKN